MPSLRRNDHRPYSNPPFLSFLGGSLRTFARRGEFEEPSERESGTSEVTTSATLLI